MSEVWDQTTPAGFALRLLGDLSKQRRISIADEKVLREVIMPVAVRERAEMKEKG